MNSAQRVLVDKILAYTGRGFNLGMDAASGGGGPVSDFAAAAIQLARSLVDEEVAERAKCELSAKRQYQVASIPDALLLEIPAFFNHENGPALTFMPVMEDRVRKLVAQMRLGESWKVITLEAGDVRQCAAFFQAWLRLAEGVRSEPPKLEPPGEVTVCDGKYRFYLKPGDYRVHVDRHGEPWLSIEQGHKAVAALVDEVTELREWLSEWKDANTKLVSGMAQAHIDQAERSIEQARGLRKLNASSAYPLDLPGVATVYGAIRSELDNYRRFGAKVFNWVHEHGTALKPTSNADTYGEGVRESKKQVRAMLERFGLGPDEQVNENLFVLMLDDRAFDFRRLYAHDSLEAFLAWARARVSPAVQAAFEMAVEPKLKQPKPAPLDTVNRHLVTAHQGEVLMREPLTFQVMTGREALQLASWLIVGAELADYDQALETAIETVKAIRAT